MSESSAVTPDCAETIVAMATPLGRGGLAVIRVSGSRAREIVGKRLPDGAAEKWPVRRPVLRGFFDARGALVDRVLVTFFPSPASYTGEDVIEISCHGSPVVARRITELIVGAGGRVAEPGEFTLRAFLNGKMDLAQAEAVRDLIESQTGFQAKVAAEQIQGKLSGKLAPLKDEIVRVVCHMETALEFVEDDVEPRARKELIETLVNVDRELGQLETSFDFGRIVQEGILVAICGKPNAGKSSLFNALLLEDRAIVTEIPGTTRDALTETVSLEGIPARLVDTAGIRETRDQVEHLGVEKSLEYLSEADVVLFVLDRTASFSGEDAQVWQRVREKPCVLVLNKEDLNGEVEVPREVKGGCVACVSISALERRNLDELRGAILRVVAPGQEAEKETVIVTNIRHKRCIELAREHLRAGMDSYRSGMSEEFPIYDLHKALDAIGQVTGETTVEDILQEIFSTFCIGK